jgi:hypothetical protein
MSENKQHIPKRSNWSESWFEAVIVSAIEDRKKRLLLTEVEVDARKT